MPEKEVNTEWTEKLKSLLLEQTKVHFGDKQPTPEEFTEFLEQYTYYAGKDASFIEDMYKLYLDRITRTGEQLEKHIRP
jgi:esterase/lipase